MTDTETKDTKPEITDSNQTQFTFEEPLYGRVRHPDTEVKVTPDRVIRRSSLPLVIAAAAGGLLLLVGVLVVFAPDQQGPGAAVPSPSAQAIPTELDPLAERHRQLKQELQQADPTRPGITFPTVQMVIRLDAEN